MPRPGRLLFLVLFTASLVLFTLPNRLLNSIMPSARAAGTYTVDWAGDAPDSNTADGVCNDGNNRCTLRAAIEQANAVGGANTINVTSLGTITLTSALPAVATDLTISGAGARRVAVSGAGAFRVFSVNSGVTATISGLTISGGRAASGAGISNAGTLTVINCAVTHNVATNSGGGINNNGDGRLNVTGSTIAYNSANSAGGVFNISNATLANTTVSSNTSATTGGGVGNFGPLTLSSVTIYRNTSQQVGGGVYSPGIGLLNFGNTIIAGNSGGSQGPDCAGANFSSQDYNLIESTAGCSIIGSTAHNITGFSPSLGPLQENGGPTLTHAPLPNSVVIDQGNSALATDQRGRTRPADSASAANAAGGNGSDIGAVEIQAAEHLSVNSLADTNDGQCDAQNCTLREAINAANAAADYNAIHFTAAGTINLTGALPDLATDMTVEGPGAKSLTVGRATGGEYRIFTVATGVTARISGLTVTGGDPGGSNGGGGVSNSGTLTLAAVAITANNAIGGGGIYNSNGGTLYLVNSTLSANTAGFGSGGGIFNGGTLYVQNSTISSNSVSSGSGGGIFNIGGPAFVTNSTVSNNINRGIVNVSTSSDFTLTGTIVANNQSTFPGQIDLGGGSSGFVSNGYNLIRTPGSIYVIEARNPGTNIYNQDPKLGPLADWGGPTRTHALLSDSPAIDKGKSLAADFHANPSPADQRGAARPFDFTSIAPAAGGDNSDIGAFELNPAAEAVTSKATNEDSALSFTFFVGDQAVTSIAATSSDQTLVPDSNISVTGAGNDTERAIRITPAANQYGSATITVTLTGSIEGTVTRTFRLTVGPVNDAPSFTKGGDQTVPEDAGPRTVANWAAGVSAGPNESSQTLSFVITGNTNPALFSAGPSISSNGTLTYTPAPNANGTAVVTVVLKDGGGTLNGGQDTSAAQTFSITVTPVNDAPVAAGANVLTDEDTSKTITLGATDVEGDVFTFQIVSGPSRGTLTGSGASRTYTPAADFNGADSFTFKAVDANGAESNVATVNINVAAVNDAPGNNVPGAQLTARDTPLVFSAANGNALSVSDIDAGSSPVHVTLAATNGAVTLSGTSGLSFVSGDGADDATVTFTGTIANVNAALAGLAFKPTAGFDGAASLQITAGDQGASGSGGAKTATDTVSITVARSTLEFSQATYTVAEGTGSLAVTVRRAGDASQAASVDYATDDGTNNTAPPPCSAVTGLALDRCDFTRAHGALHFGAGETEKSILVLVNDDSYTEGTETAHVTLTAAGGGGAVLGPRASAMFEITDDAPESSANPIDDSTKFVRQHYHDFLNREPDAAGLAFWSNQVAECESRPEAERQGCREIRRINVSAAFFVSTEFQETGYLVERMYKVAYGDATSPNVPGTVPVIRFNEFLTDTQEIGRGIVVGVGDWENRLEANKQAFALGLVQRPRFTAGYPSTMTAAQFVDKLAQNAGLTLTQSERNQLIDTLGSTPSDTSKRTQVLRAMTDDSRLRQAEFNRAFVLMQYFGYLRRNPDDAPEAGLNYAGWKFWLDKLNSFNGDYIEAEMVKAFIFSDEYRKRFGQ